MMGAPVILYAKSLGASSTVLGIIAAFIFSTDGKLNSERMKLSEIRSAPSLAIQAQ